MNAPIILAQLSGSQPTGNSPPRNLKIEKPQNNQAVSIRLDGNTKLDFSDIASEKLTFVRVGDKLIVLFDNQSTVSIDPMFDSAGNPLPNVSFEVGPDRIVDGTAFANLFPITTDQSVLPAAGAAAGGPAAGANFSNPNAGSLGGSGARLALLGNEEGGGGADGGTDAPANPQPILGPIPVGNVDDEGLSEGNIGGPGDAPGSATSITNSLNVDFGTDVVGRQFAFTAAQDGLNGLTSGGQAVNIIITTINGQPAIIGFVGGDSTIAANQVFTITLDNGPINGAYTFTLLRPLDHPIADTEDTITVTVGFTATDGSGDTGTGSFSVAVNDDSPDVVIANVQSTIVDEDGLFGGNDGDTYTSGDALGHATRSTGSLGIRWGADRFDTNDTQSEGVSRQDGAVVGSANNADLINDGRSVYFTSTTVLVNGVAVDATHPLTSHGEIIEFKLDESGTKLIGFVRGEGEGSEQQSFDRVVFTVTLSDDGSGSYVFNLLGPLDHPIANTEDDLALQFGFTARDSDRDTFSSNFTVTVDDDAPIQTNASAEKVAINEDDLADFNPFYIEGVPVFGLLQGSLGSSPFDGGTGLLGTVPVSGSLSEFVSPGADGPGSFHLVSEAQAETLLQTIGPNGGPLWSHGDVVNDARFVNIDGVGEILGFFASDGRLVAGLFVGDTGNYNFRLFDQIDHPVGDNPATQAWESVKDIVNLDLSRFVQYTDFDGDTITLKPNTFSVDVKDDAPIAVGTETGTANEDDLADFNPLYPIAFDFLQGSLGTSPFDGFTDGSATGLFGTVPVYGFLTDNVIGGADEFGKFDIVPETIAEQLLATLDNGQPFKSHGDVIDHVQTIDIPGLGETMGFFASDGRLVFGLFVSEGGFYNFRLFDQLDHPVSDTDPANGEPIAIKDVINIDLSKFVIFTDFDGDTIDLGTNRFVMSVVDDIPVLTGQTIRVTLDESDLNNFLPGWDLIPSELKALFPVEGSGGTSPDSDTSTLLFNTTGKSGLLNEIIGTNVVNGGADEFGKFALVSDRRAELLIPTEFAGLKSKGEVINRVEILDLGLIGEVMGFFAGDRLIFTLTVNDVGFYDIRLWDQIDHTGNNGGQIDIDLSKFVTYTDFDGDAIDLGNDTLVLRVIDDAPIATGTKVIGLVEEEQNVILTGGDMLHGNEDMDDGAAGEDQDTSSNPLAINPLAANSIVTTHVTVGSIASIVKTGADENGTFSFKAIAELKGQAVLDGDGQAIMSRGQAVTFGLRTVNGVQQVIGIAGDDGDGVLESGERLIFTLVLTENPALPFGITLPIDILPPGLTDGVVNDQFQFTLYDQIDHAVPVSGATEDIKNIDLSQVIRFTDADGDAIVFDAHTFEIKVIDDKPRQTGTTIKVAVEEEHNAGASFPEVNHGNEDNDSGVTPDLDNDTNSNRNNITNIKTGDLRSLVSVGTDEVTQTITNVLGTPVVTANHGTFFFGTKDNLPALSSKGQPLTYTLTDSANDADTLFDTLTATSADGRTVFTLTLDNDGTNSGDYVFTLLDQLDHAAGNGENVLNIDFSSVVNFKDFDGDTITLSAGSFSIDVIDDTPVLNTAATPVSKNVDEDSLSTTSSNPGPDLVNGNLDAVNAGDETSFSQAELRTLIKSGADEDMTFSLVPAISGVVKDFGGNDVKSDGKLVRWAVDADGSIIGYADQDSSAGFNTGDRIIFRFSQPVAGGAINFDLSGQIDHPAGGDDNQTLTLNLSPALRAEDYDHDFITLNPNTVLVAVEDDLPILITQPAQLQVLDDEVQTIFAPNVDPVSGGQINTASGTLFVHGADLVKTIAVSSPFDVIGKNANGFAITETVNWTLVSSTGGEWTFVAVGGQGGFYSLANPAGTLVIRDNGTYNLTLSAPLRHDVSGAEEETKTLTVNFTVTDRDNDSVPGSFSVSVKDDVPLSAGSVTSVTTLDDEAQTLFAGNDTPDDGVANVNIAKGQAGALFTAGADGVSEISIGTGPSLTAIYKDDNGFARQEATTAWSAPVIGADGSYTFTALGSVTGAVIATLKIGADGSYTFTVNAPLAHSQNGGTEELFSPTFNYSVRDGDGDIATGTLTINVNDDMPNGPPLNQSEQPIVIGPVLDDETAPLPRFTGNAGQIARDSLNGPQSFVINDVTPNVVSAEGAAGTLFQPGADGVSSIAVLSQPFNVLATNFNGLSQAVQVQWSTQPTYGPGGEAIWTATSFDYDLFVNSNQMGDVAATLIIRTDGSYKLTLNAPLAHTEGSSDQNIAVTEESALLTFNYTTVDGDGDTASGQLLIAVNDDTPYSKGSVLSSTKIDDDAQTLFQGNDAPDDFVTNTKVAQAGVGALFSAGADGVGQFPITAPFPLAGMPQLTVDFAGAGFQVVVKDQFGRASTETATWGSATYLNGVVRYEATSQTYNQFANPNTTPSAAAVLEIGLDGSYKLTLFAPVVQSGAGELDDNKRLIFSYTVTDGDGDTGSGQLAVDINDDAPTHAIVPANSFDPLTPVKPPSLDDEAQTLFGVGSGNPGAATEFDHGDVDVNTNTASGQLFRPGADGIIANDGVGPEGIVISAPNFSVIAKSFNGFAEVVEVHWVKDQTAPLGNVWLAVGDFKYNPLFGQGPAAAVLTVNFDGTYTLTMNAPVAHGTNSRDEEDDVTLRINYTATDADGDTAIGAVDITIDDDTPVTKGLVQVATNLDDEGQGGGNDTPADGIANVKTVSGAAGALFSAGADGVKSIVFDPTTPTTVINVFNTAGSPSLAFWGVDQFNPVNGAVKYILVGGGYGSQNPAAVLIVRTDGSYDFTLNAPLGHGDQTSEDTLTLGFGYTVTDGDGDVTTGRLEIQVNDDTPTPSITLGNVLITDETSGVQNGTGDVGLPVPDNFDTPTPLLASLGTIISGATSAAGFVTIAAGADGVLAVSFTDASGNLLVGADSGLTTLDGTKILLTTDTVRPNLLVGMANGSVAIAIQIDPLTGTVSVAEYVPIKHLNAADHNDTVSLAGVAYITVMDADSDTKTTSSPIQITFHDDGPVVGAPEAKTADETGLPSVSAVHGSLAINFGTDGMAAVPVFFSNQTSAVANIHLVNDQNAAVDLTTLTSRGETLQYKLLDASTLVAYTGSVEPSAIDASSVVFSVKLSANSTNPNGAYDFVLRQPLDDLPSVVTDLKFTFDFVAKDGDGDVTPLSTFIVTVHDGVPTIGATEAKTVDEEGLSSSIATQIDSYVGDVSGSNTTAIGSLAINWNGDDNNVGVANRSVQFLAALDNTNPSGLFSDGVQVHYSLSSDKTVLTATKGVGGTTVFSVTLDDVTGQYTFTQFDNLDHNKTTGANVEDDIVLSFGFTATDSDGDVSQPGTITVTVDDDAPARTGNVDPGAVSEVPLDNPNGAPFVQTTSQSLNIAYGADGIGQKLAFATDSNGNPLHPQGLSSDGVSLSYIIRTIASGEQQLVAFKSTETVNQPVFIVELTSPENPTYTFTLWQNLDHDHSGISDTSLSLTFTVIATDGDNDTVAQSFVVTVADDLPTVTIPQNSPIIADETAGAQGSTNDVDLSATTAPAALPAGAINLSHSAAQYVTVDPGADGLKSIVLGNADGTKLVNVDSGLKALDGTSILLTTDATNPHLVIGKAGATTVLAIYFDPSDNSVWVAQYKPIFHLGANNSNDEALLNSVVFVTAIDGDNDPRGALLQVRIRDDGPTLPAFLPQMQAHVVRQLDDEAQTLFTPNFGNGLSTGDVPDDVKSVTGATGALFNPGIDGTKSVSLLNTPTTFNVIYKDANGFAASETITWSGGQNPDGSITFRAQSTHYNTGLPSGLPAAELTINKDGSYSFTLNAPVKADGSAENDLSLAFNYRVTDGDNDSADGILRINVNDDTPTVPPTIVVQGVPQPNATAQLDDEAQALFPANPSPVGNLQPGDVEPDAKTATGTLFSAGADGVSAITIFNLQNLSFNVIAKNASGLPFSETAGWSQVTADTAGTVKFVAQSNSYNLGSGARIPAAELVIGVDGTYTFKLNAPVAHTAGSGESGKQLDFLYSVTDGDNDSATGVLRIDINDDTPTVPPLTFVQGVPQPNVSAQFDDEAQTVFPGNPGDTFPGSGDVSDDVKTVTGTLFSAGADGTLSILVSAAAPTFRVIFKDSTGLASSEDASWLPAQVNTDGSVIYRAESSHYNASTGTFAAVLTIGADGAYTFTLNAPIAHNQNVIGENNAALNFTYSVTDGDGDTASGSLRINVNDDGPTVPQAPPPVQGQQQPNVVGSIDDEAQQLFPANNQPADSFPDVRTATGTLFSAGADGVQSVAITSQLPSFNVLYKDTDTNSGTFGAAVPEGVTWFQEATVNGAFTWTALSNHYSTFANPAAKLVINPDGTYTFTLFAPVAHPNADNLETARSLNFDYLITDGDGDSAGGRLNIQIGDDTLAATGTVLRADVYESEIANNNGSPVTGSASPNADDKNGDAGNSFGNPNVTNDAIFFGARGSLNSLVAGADGVGSFTTDLTNLSTSLRTVRSNGELLTYSQFDSSTVLASNSLGTVFAFHVNQDGSYTFSLFRALDDRPALVNLTNTAVPLSSIDAPGSVVAGGSFVASIGFQAIGRLPDGDLIVLVGNPTNATVNWSLDNFSTAGIDYPLTIPPFSSVYVNVGLLSGSTPFLLNAAGGGTIFSQNLFPSSGSPLGFVNDTTQTLDQLTLDLSSLVTVIDGDGDRLELKDQLLITVKDDVPVAGSGNSTDEDNRVSGGPAFSGGTAVKFGADGAAAANAFVLSASVTASNASSDGKLYSNGELVSFAIVNGTLYGYVGNVVPNSPFLPFVVFSLQPTTNQTDVGYTFILNRPLDHAFAANGKTTPITLTFAATATDGDGDVAPVTFAVQVDAAGNATNSAGSLDYANLTSRVFVNLSEDTVTFGNQTVAANTATDKDVPSNTNGIVGKDNVTGVINVSGGSNDDVIVGGAEANTLSGNGGNDTFIYAVGGSNDIVDGGTGTDKLIVNGNGDKQIVTISASDNDNDPTNGVQDPILVQIDETGNGSVDATVSVSNVEDIELNLGGGNDEVFVNGQSFAGSSLAVSTITVNEGEGNDTLDLRSLTLSNHRVVADGGAGTDTVKFGFAYTGRGMTEQVGTDGVKLTFTLANGETVTHEFKGYESFEFTNGTRTYEQLFNTGPIAADFTPGVSGFQYSSATGHYYQYLSGTQFSPTGSTNGAWAFAQSAAAVRGGYLANVTSQAEHDFLNTTYNGTVIAPTFSATWIGGSDFGHEGTWTWQYGAEAGQIFYIKNDPTVHGFSAWALPVEPNNGGLPISIPSQNYAAIWNRSIYDYVTNTYKPVGTFDWDDTGQTQLNAFASGAMVERDYFTDKSTAALISKASILASVSDADGDTLTITGLVSATTALGGTVTIVGNDVRYDPTTSATLAAMNGNYQTLQDSFQYTVSDGHGGTTTGTVKFNVGVAQHAAVVASPDKIVETSGPDNGHVYTGQVRVTDLDPNSTFKVIGVGKTGDFDGSFPLFFTPVNEGTGTTFFGNHGVFVFNSDGSYTYTAGGGNRNFDFDTIQSTVIDPATGNPVSGNWEPIAIQVQDSSGFITTKNFRVDFQAANEAPVATTYTPVLDGFQYSAATGHYYQYVTQQQANPLAPLTVANAQGYAASKGGYLANVTSQAEHDFLNVTYNGTVIAPFGQATWIGGSDFGNEGTWTWRYGAEAGQVFYVRGGDPLLNGFTAWAPNEPNNSGGSQNFAAIWNRPVSGSSLGTFDWDDTGQTQLNASGAGAIVERDYFTDKTTAVSFTKASILANVSDFDGDTLTIISVSTSAKGANVQIVGDNIVYDPNGAAGLAGLTGYATTEDSFTYTVSDGHGNTVTGTVKFNVGVAQHAPVIAAPDVIVETSGSDNGRVYTGQVHVTDADANDTFKVIGIARFSSFNGSLPNTYIPVNEGGAGTTIIASHGTFVFKSDGSYTYTAGGVNNFNFDSIQSTVVDANGNPISGNWEPLAIQVQDLTGQISVRNFRIDFQAANDAPVANPDAVDVSEGASVSTNVILGIGGIGQDVDPDNSFFSPSNSLQVSGVAKGVVSSVAQNVGVGTDIIGDYGTLRLFANGNYLYIANAELAEGATRTDTFSYTVKDPAGVVSNATTLTVTVTGVNDAPVISGLVDMSVAENATGALLRSFTVADVDTANGLGFRVLDANDAVDTRFVVVAASGTTFGQPGTYELRLAAGQSFDFETENGDGDPTIALKVEVNDQASANNIAVVPVTVTITDLPPVISSPTTATVAENVSTLTTVYTAVAADPAGGTVTYSLTGTDANLFNIDSGTGIVTFKVSPNYEAPSDNGANRIYDINVVAKDASGVSSSQAVAITLTDVNEAPTAVTFANAVTTMAENSNVAGGVKVADIGIADDALGAETLSLTGSDASSFEIRNGNQLFYIGSSPDFETKSSYQVTVSADDPTVGSNPDASQSFTLTITDVNEAPTAVTFANAVTTMAENSNVAGGVKVADIGITDDALGTETLTLTGNDAASFEIRNGNQLFYIGSSPNFEAKSSYQVTVNANDPTVGGNPDASQSFTLTITDVNEAPTSVTFSNTVTTMAENSNVTGGVKVADIGITDDALGSETLTLSGTDMASFEIRNGNQLFYIGSSPNFEAKSSYQVTVNANDPTVGGNPDASQSFTLSITDMNEAPTAVTFANAVTTMAENSNVTGGVKVADIGITDDALGSETLTLSGTDASSFEIRNGNQLFYIGSSPNFEAKSSYQVTVSADDPTVGTTPDASQSFTLTITDVNEAPTAVTFTNAVTTMAENSNVTGGIKVADIGITDDALGSETLTLSGTDMASFEIRNGNQLFYIGSSPNFEAKASYQVTVNANDPTVGGNPDASQAFTLTITDVNDAPVLGGATAALNSIQENPVTNGGTLVSALVDLTSVSGGLDNVTDADAGALTGIALTGVNASNGNWQYSTNNGTTWTNVGSVSNSSALLLATTALIRFQPNTDFDGTISDAITYRAWDRTTGLQGDRVSTVTNGGSSAFSTGVATSAITVTPSNHAPDAVNDTLTFGGGGGGTPTGSGWVQWTAASGGNDHWYKLVTGATTWDNAFTGAAAQSSGAYLLTITSAAEQSFVLGQFGLGQMVMLGGSDEAQEGTWRWVAGPEAGSLISGYTPWNTGEPNNWGGDEDYLMINRFGGPGFNQALWNDGTKFSSSDTNGYVAEWGGLGGNGGVSEDVVTTFSTSLLLANDTDPDSGDTLTVTAVSGTGFSLSGTTITFNPTGIASLQALNAGQTADVSFTYTLSDGKGGTDTATATLKVNGVNDAAVITGTSTGTVTEAAAGGSAGTPTATGDLLSTDVDNTTDSWQSVTTATSTSTGYGTYTVTSAGVWTYNLNNANTAVNNLNTNQTLTDSFSVLTADGTSKTVNITINGVTDKTGTALDTLAGGDATDGSAMKYTGSFAGTGTLTFTYGFSGVDAGSADYRDFAYVVIDGVAVMLRQFNTGVGAVSGATFTYQFTGGGNHTLGFGASDFYDTAYSPTLTIDNVMFKGSLLTNGGFSNGLNSWSTIGTVVVSSGVAQITANSSISEAQIATFLGLSDPIVIDLDNDGIDLSSKVAFDLNADGTAETVAWAGPRDGLLVVDHNHSGKIENGQEVLSPWFGNGGFADALSALASLDSNHDGVIDAKDADFSQLKVWMDANSDGVTQDGELKTLSEAGVVSIDLDAKATDHVIDGQQVIAEGHVTFDTGVIGQYAAVSLDATQPNAATPAATEPVRTGDLHTVVADAEHALQGTAAADRFAVGDLNADHAGIILDYNAGQGDVIDLSALLASVSGNKADAVRFVDGNGHASLASANGSGILDDGDLKVQINTGEGWHDVAAIKDTGANLTAGADVIKLMLDTAQQQVHV